ncbi:MAG TPA: type II secretion system F family protein [Thermoanaerobaculia bacterium]|nr:type II secretion system F family protein [Thermoanaerobaculia bacterium]
MQYICRLGMPDGRVVEDVRRAVDESALRAELEKQGIHLFEARPRGLPRRLAVPALSGKKKGIPVQRFLVFNQELASLLKAGLPLLQALDLMLERMEKGSFRDILTDVRDRVKNGQELSEAFAVHAESFPRLYPASLKAGEKSGELEKVIRRFIRYLKLVTDAKKRMVSALMYPAILIGVSLAMILVLSILVVPRFKEFFRALEVDLPLITRITLGISTALVTNLPILVAAIAVGLLFFQQWKQTADGGITLDRWKLSLPLLGDVLHRFALSEFCRSLATLLSGGIPLLSSFEISCDAVGNRYVRSKLAPTIKVIREGGAFHRALEESGVVSPLAVDMVKVGEATGALDEMLNSVSDFLDDEVETRTQRILSVIEPLMLVFLGVIISVILISIYLPLFSAMSQSKS